MTLAIALKANSPSERHRKVEQTEHFNREGHLFSAKLVKTFRKPAMLKTAPLDCEDKAT